MDEDELPPALPARIKTTAVVPKDQGADVEVTRKNIYGVIARTDDALEELADIAFASQHPRSYEVLAGLLRVSLEANRDLAALDRPNGPSTINNTLVMTGAEMLDMVKKKL